MLKIFFPALFMISIIWCGCTMQKRILGQTSTEAVAFPGAEGFGKYTTGGRGGFVYTVTNLNNDGEGSLRYFLNKKGPRIIVFAVSGTIHLETPLNIKANTTIAGQTAPGDGICIADRSVELNGDNIMVRYIRFRMGDKYQNTGMVQGAGSDDALGGTRRKNIIVDHCSISWSTDEALSVYAGDSTTIQWNIISEPLNYSYHFESGDKDFEQHGYGGILGGKHISIHHNLYAHCVSRTPRFDGNRNIKPEIEFADFKNNVIYNWGINNVYGGEGGQYNIINNYYKPGPNTSKNTASRIANPFKKEGELPFGKWYIAGNYTESSAAVSADNWKGVVMDKGTASDAAAAKANTPFDAAAVYTSNAATAYGQVLQSAGASFSRDTLDARIIQDVKMGTGRIIDVQGGYPHATPYSQSLQAWPFLQGKQPLQDSDKDGMPDEWEEKNGLKKEDAADGVLNNLHSHYTNIEVYINSLVAAPKK